MKLLLTLLIVYFAYKIMFKPKGIDPPSRRNPIDSNKEENKGEYVDYEEVD